MAEDKLFVEATEEDVPSIIGLRQRIWSTTYRGIYPEIGRASCRERV